MKHVLLILGHLLLINILWVEAQPMLSITPNPAEQTFQVDLNDLNLDLEVYAEVKNTGSDTLHLLWTRYEMNVPQDWYTQVCDVIACYNPDVSTNYDPEHNYTEPVILLPDSSFTLIFHVLPNGTAGTGVYDLDFSMLEDPDNVFETVVFRPTVENNTTTSLSPELAVRQIRLFPNPATEYIELTNSESVDQLAVYNILGRQVRKFNVVDGKRYYLTGLPNGMYLVSLVNNQKGILRTMRLSKRSFRP
jgi:hypothetical protein